MSLDELEKLAREATPGPWKVVLDVHPHKLGGNHHERRIATVWEHPQLKGPMGVVNLSYGLGVMDGAPAITMVQIGESDANYIAAANPAEILRLVAIARAAERNVSAMKRLAVAMEWMTGRTEKPADFDAVVNEATAAENGLREALDAGRASIKGEGGDV